MRFIIRLILPTMLLLPVAAVNAGDISPVGEWRWFNKVTVTIKADGTVTESKGHRGIWKWTNTDPTELKIIWERTTDTLKLSADGNQLQGRSSDQGIAVSAERIDRLAPLLKPSSAVTAAVQIPGEFVGLWTIFYDNGHVRTYSISAGGTVSWTQTHGRAGPNKKAKIVRRDKDFLIDFGDEDKIERISATLTGLRIEHFNPKSKYADGEPPIVGTGMRKK
jgi:hypothetical protein